MRIGTGVDLTRIDRIASLCDNPAFLRRVFCPSELSDARPAHLAGIFAAKEAVFKALGHVSDWHAVTIELSEAGRPLIRLGTELRDPRLRTIDVSISHEGEYAVALAVALFVDEEEPA